MGCVDFQKWLSELRDLPSSAPQWERASQFIDSATQVIADKEIERNQTVILVGAIGDIIKRFSVNLKFLSIHDELASWIPVRLPSNIRTIMEAISEFEVNLINFEAFKDTDPPLVELNQAADSVTSHFRTLYELLTESQSFKDSDSISSGEESPDTFSIAPIDEVEEGANSKIDEPETLIYERQPNGGQSTEKEISVDEEGHPSEAVKPLASEDEHVESSSIEALDMPMPKLADIERDIDKASPETGCISEEPDCREVVVDKYDEVASDEPSSTLANKIEEAADSKTEESGSYTSDQNLKGSQSAADEVPAETGVRPSEEVMPPVSTAEQIENAPRTGPVAPKLESSRDRDKEIHGEGIQDHGSAPEGSSVPLDFIKEERRYGIEESERAANRYLETSSLHDLETFMWSLIAEDDLSAAYWVARHLAEQNYENVIPPALLKAVQGSRWLVPASNRYVSDLFEFTQEYDGANVNSAQELLELAASLCSSLIAPHSNMWGLLKTPDACPAAGPIVTTIGEFALSGHALRPEYIEGMGESVRNQDEIIAASAQAKWWLEETAPGKSQNFRLAMDVWQHLIDTDGIISEMLSLVKDDDRAQLQIVKEKSAELTLDPESLINHIGRSLVEGPWRPITGRARNWLLKGIAEAKSLAERWSELVEYESDVQIRAQDRYLIQLTTDLRSEAQKHSNQFVQALQELTTASNPVDLASAAQCALRSVGQALQSLAINIDVDIPYVPAVVRDLTVINRDAGNHNLSAAVGRRLLWTDTVEIGDDGIWTGKSLEGEIRTLTKGVSESMTLEQAIEQRFRIQDFRFFAIMRKELPPEHIDNLDNHCKRSQQDSLLTLKEHKERVKDKVLQAARDGVVEIDDDNWIMYDLVIADIENVVESEDEILNYSPMSIQLQDIHEGIEREEVERQRQLQREWNDEISGLVDNTAPAIQTWQAKFMAAQDYGNIRVMEDCVIRLRNHSLGDPLPDTDSMDEFYGDRRNPLSEFVAFVDGITDIEEHVRRSSGLTALEASISF